MDSPPTIEIFRPGRFTATDGTVVSFSAADLRAAVAAYDPVAEPAPLVKGHPQLDHPAFGWVGGLAMDGDVVVATPSDLEPTFAEEVRTKRYRRVSASWYPPAHPQNPRPGAFYLKHVGFLGASAPAVRGLAPVHFSEAQNAGAITIDLDPTEIPMTDTPAAPTIDFAEREAKIAADEAAIAAREQAVVDREAAALAAEQLAVHDRHVAFAETQVAAGKLAPAGRDRVVGLLDTLSTLAVVNFGEADGELPPVDAFRRLFDEAVPVVNFGEVAPADKDKDPLAEDPRAIADRAVAFVESEKAAGRIVSVVAAVRHVRTTAADA